MTTVSSLVVQRRLASLRQVEEALARQVLYGGDVVTNLLEVAPPPATDEPALTQALADALGIPALEPGAMRVPAEDAVAKVPRSIAEEHGLVPLRIREGALVVALSEPLAPEALATLRERLGLAVEQRAAPLVRLRQALERAYGVPMDRRSRRLVAQLEGERPRTSDAPRASLLPEIPDPASARPKVESKAPAKASIAPPSHEVKIVEATKNDAPSTTIRASSPGPNALQWFLRNAQTRPSAPNAQLAAPAPTLVRKDATASSPRIAIPSTKRRRGPFTREDAERVLGEATSADMVFSTVLEYAQQYLTYLALFLVKEDVAEGWDAHGPGASGSRVRKMGVPLDLPSILKTARERAAPVLQPRTPDPQGLDAVLAADLDRPSGGDVLVAPVVVGKRTVALVYGDDGTAPLAVDELSDVFAVTTLAGRALARIIVQRKKRAIPDAPKEANVAGRPQLDLAAMPTPSVVDAPVAPKPEAPKAETPKPIEAKKKEDRPRERVSEKTPALAVRARALTEALLGKKPVPPPQTEAPPVAKAKTAPPPPIKAPESQAPITPPPPSPRPYTTKSSHPPPAQTPYPLTMPLPARRNTTPLGVPAPSTGKRQTDPYGVMVQEKAPESEPRSSQPIARVKIGSQPSSRTKTDRQPAVRLDAETLPSEATPADLAPATEPTAPAEPIPLPPPPSLAGPKSRAKQAPIPREEPSADARVDLTPHVDVVLATPEIRETPIETRAKTGRTRPPPIPKSSAPPIKLPRKSTPTPPPSDPMIEVKSEPPAPMAAAPQTSEPISIDYAEVTEHELEAILAEASDQAPKSIRESERVEHYSARPPPRPFTGIRNSDMALPKVIVALDPEHVILVERLVRGGETGEDAEAKLRALGAAALPAVMDRFPGPTRCDRTTPISQLPPPRGAGPILSFLARAGRVALIEVIARTGDPAPETRFWATYLLTELIDPEAANALVPRLVDDDIAVRRMAAVAARTLLQSQPRVASHLVDPLVGVLLDSGAPNSLRVRAAQALAEVRDARAAEGLVLAVDTYEKEVAEAAHDALVVLTRHDPKQRPGDKRDEEAEGAWSWSTWFAEHGKKHRIEWLIEALMDEDESVREAAGAELKATTKVYFGYYANMPRAERKAAYDRYLGWWRQNARKFTDG